MDACGLVPGWAHLCRTILLRDSLYTSIGMANQRITLRGHDLSPAQQRLVFDTVLSIQQSTYFYKSKRFPALLEYIVRHSIEGNLGNLRERTIGIDLFDRPEDYDSSNDPVARVAIAEVRKRLALYYSEHLDAEIRIEVPVGSYEAEFHVHASRENRAFVEPHGRNRHNGTSEETIPSHDTFVSAETTDGAEPLDQHSGDFEHREHPLIDSPAGSDLDVGKQPQRRAAKISLQRFAFSRRVYVWASIAVIVLLTAIVSAHLLSSSAPINKFWAPVVNSQGQVLIAVALPLHGTPGDHADSPGSMDDFLVKQLNYPIPDMSVADSIKTFLSRRHSLAVVSLASSITLSELHQAPAVVLGSSRMNRWVQFLNAGLRFQFELDQGGLVHWIQDTSNPANRNWAVNLSVPYSQAANEYALITRGFNATTGQWWIGIGSTTGLGTVGAEQILTDPTAMKALNAQLPQGWEHKNLQIVVEFKVVDGSLGASHVVATHLW